MKAIVVVVEMMKRRITLNESGIAASLKASRLVKPKKLSRSRVPKAIQQMYLFSTHQEVSTSVSDVEVRSALRASAPHEGWI